LLSLGSAEENLHFLVLEVIRQLERTRRYLLSPSEKTRQTILRGDDYVDHLRKIIQRKCFVLVREADRNDRFELELLRSIDLITGNLERIADFCENLVGQFHHLAAPELVSDLDIDANFDEMIRGLRAIEPALRERDVQQALDICQIERRLDELHATAFRETLDRLDAGGDAQTNVTILFMSHYFERMGDALLNVGEAILSAALGERIKIDEFQALRDTMASSGTFGGDAETEVVTLEALGETRSGCRIDRVVDRSSGEERMIVFKEGPPEKLAEERECVQRWNRILPGYAPGIYSFQQRGDSGAILFEYLPGRTFEQLLLQSQPPELRAALARLKSALREIWTKTRLDEPTHPDFIAQVRKRLPAVYELHPEFARGAESLGGVEVTPFDELVARCGHVDEALVAPFSVLGHGDLNVDNVIYDPELDSIRLIDLHRSHQTDFVQDVSVFLVSHFRLRVFDRPVRARIQDVISRVHDFAAEFARETGDTTFEARLAAGLARSFVTSARFVLDEEFAKGLFLRGRYLLEQLSTLRGEALLRYRAPEDLLVD